MATSQIRLPNYRIITFDTTRRTDTFFVVGTYLDIYYDTPADIVGVDYDRILVSIDGGQPIPISSLPIVTNRFYRLTFTALSGVPSGLLIKFIVGDGLERLISKVYVTNFFVVNPDFEIISKSVVSCEDGYTWLDADSQQRYEIIIKNASNYAVRIHDRNILTWFTLSPGQSLAVHLVTPNSVRLCAESPPGATAYVEAIKTGWLDVNKLPR